MPTPEGRSGYSATRLHVSPVVQTERDRRNTKLVHGVEELTAPDMTEANVDAGCCFSKFVAPLRLVLVGIVMQACLAACEVYSW